MNELVKPWNDGGSLTVTYEGNGNGSAVFSSDTYEGIDREMEVDFVGGGITQTRKVRQEGIRQPIGLVGGGIFRVANGGRFGVLREEKPYTELEYIESTGTQYIDTEVKLTNNHSVAVDYQLTEARQNRKGVFGVLASNMTARFGAILSPSNSYLEFGYGAGNMYWQYGLPDTNRHYYEQRQNESYFDGVLVHTFASATFSTGVNAPLGNFTFTNYNPAKAKYFGAKIWDGSSLIRNFVPALDSDGVVCMYDLVSETFFYNKGTGNFIAGPEI